MDTLIKRRTGSERITKGGREHNGTSKELPIPACSLQGNKAR